MSPADITFRPRVARRNLTGNYLRRNVGPAPCGQNGHRTYILEGGGRMDCLQLQFYTENLSLDFLASTQRVLYSETHSRPSLRADL